MTYRKAVKPPLFLFNRVDAKNKIANIAKKILDGEENLLEEYDDIVQEFVKITKGVTPAFETDPVMYSELVERWGVEPTKMVGSEGQMRYINYHEMVNFIRGYWR